MKIFAVTMIAGCSLLAGANELFPAAFQRIDRMRNAAAAEKAYVELAGKTHKPVQRDAAFHAAIQKAVRGRNYKNTAQYLSSIKDNDLRRFASMEIAFARRQFKQLIEQSKDYKLEEWRDDLIPEAAFMRAYCYGWMKNKAAAEKNIALACKSIAHPVAKFRMIYRLANIYESFLKDFAAELSLLKSVDFNSVEAPYFYRHRIACRQAWITGKMGKVDEGIKLLQSYRGDKAGSRVFRVHQTFGDLYLMKGDKANALKHYLTAQKSYKPWAKSLDAVIKSIKK